MVNMKNCLFIFNQILMISLSQSFHVFPRNSRAYGEIDYQEEMPHRHVNSDHNCTFDHNIPNVKRMKPDFDGPGPGPFWGPMDPNPYHHKPQRHAVKDNPQLCVHGLCQDVENYPEARVKQILNRYSALDSYFQDVTLPIDFNNRAGFDDEESLCDTRVYTLYPQKANNTMNVERTIINVEGHKQGIVFETCIQNAKCKFSESFPFGYESFCKQKYVIRRLMVLSEDGKDSNVAFDSFEVPSCCVCTIKKNE